MENENSTVVQPANSTQHNGRFKKLLTSNLYILLAFGISAVIMLFIFFVYKMAPFGDITILRMDLYHQYGPLFSELYTRLAEGKSMIYSWYTGLGGSFLGNFYNYLSSPLSFLILFFGEANITEAISFFILMKSALSSAFFCYFIKKSYGQQNFFAVAFSVLYSMCGYFLAYYWNVMWLDGMMLLPLIILGIQFIIKERKWMLYTVSMTVMMFANYYIAMMLCIVSVLYFIAYFFSAYSTEIKGVGKTFINRSFMFGLSSVLAAGLSAFSLLPTYFALQSSSATGGVFPKDFKVYFSFFDFLANHLAAITPTIRSSGDDVMPNVYCGIIVLILIPLYIFSKSISKKEKLCNLALLGIIYISFNFNTLNYIWHGMHFPNDLPYRFSFVYSFILLTMAYKAITHLSEFSKKQIGMSIIGVFAFIMLVEKLGSKNVTQITVIISVIFVIVYALLLMIYKSDKLDKKTFADVLLIAICLELSIATPDLYDIDQPKTNYASDKPVVSAILDKIGNDDPGFYRLEISDSRTHNDPAWYGYNGISTFSSMAHEKVSYLSDQLGMDTNRINSYRYRPQTPVYNSMFNLKYLLSKELIDDPDLYTLKFASGQYYVYENNYCLPIGFAVNNSIEDWDILSSNPFKVQNNFIQKATNNDNLFPLEEMVISNMQGINCNLSNLSNTMGSHHFTVSDTNQNASITVYLNPSAEQRTYLYIKSSDISSVNIKSSRINKTIEVSEAYIIDMGYHKTSETIEVTLNVKDNDSGNFEIYAYGNNQEDLKTAYQQLSQGGLNITNYTETHLNGDINVVQDGILYTSIPYDKGWTCLIDGQEAEMVSIGDALCGFKIAAGKHTVELQFKAQGLSLGILISCISLLLFVIFALLYKKRVKKFAVAVNPAIPQIPKENEKFNDTSIQENIIEETTDEGFDVFDENKEEEIN